MKLRKLFAWLMTLVMLLGMVPTAQAEVINCDHNWAWRWPNGQPANCQDWKWSEKYCTKCGVGDGGFEQCGPCVPGSKTWIRPQGSNCQEYGVWEITCKHCGEWLEGREEPGPHKWSETIIEEPWCDVGGMKAVTCSLCGQWQNNGTPLAPLGHDWGSWEWAHGEVPNCVEGAWQVRNCKRCGQMEDKYVTGSHTYGNWTVDEAPTCTEKGIQYKKCIHCGDMQWLYIDETGHNMGEWYVISEAQVGLPGLEQRDCTYGCGTFEQREIPALEAESAAGLDLTLVLSSTPANGTHFVIGEEVTFTETWSNGTGKTLYPFSVSIFTCATPVFGSEIDQICSWFAEDGGGPVVPGQSGSHQLITTVTEADVARGAIYAMAELLSTVQGGADLENVTTPFVTAPCGVEENGSDELKDITFTKSVYNTPANGEFFVPGEELQFVLVFNSEDSNTAITFEEDSVYDIRFYDSLAHGQNIIYHSDKSYAISVFVYYTVTEEDAQRGYVENTAYVTFSYTEGGETVRMDSNTVTAPCGPGELPDDYQDPGSVMLTLIEWSDPDNGTHYVPGEKINVYHRLSNNSRDVTMTVDHEHFFEICGDGITEKDDWLYSKVLLPGTSYGVYFWSPPVTEADAARGYVERTTTFYLMGDDGNEYTATGSVRLPCGPGELPDDYVPPVNPDIDEDGIPNEEDPDIDGDGILNDEDDDIDGDGIVNIYDEDIDGDGNINVYDPDIDGDGIPNEEDPTPNGTITDDVAVIKGIRNTPANGLYFVPGEVIEYVITVQNNMNKKLDVVVLTDPLSADFYHELTDIAAGDSVSRDLYYTVTEFDAAIGNVINYAYAVAYVDGSPTSLTSNSVSADCSFTDMDGDGQPDDPFGIHAALDVVKSVESLPLNGSYYQEGETVSYKITYTNIGEMPLTDVMIYDAMSGMSEIATAETLNPGESRVCWLNHTVTKSDVLMGFISNTAIGQFELGGYLNTVSSNTVVVDTDGKDDEWIKLPPWDLGDQPSYTPDIGWTEIYYPTPDTEDTPEDSLPPFGTIDTEKLHSGAASCVRTITGRDNVSVSYEVDFCDSHGLTQAAALMMSQSAAAPEMQVQAAAYAVALWRADVEKLYQEIFEASDPAAKAVVMTEYIHFLTEVANYEALLKNLYPDQPALVAQKVAAMWEDKCVTLCYEAHANASERKDSLLDVTAATGAASDICTCETTAEENGKKAYKQSYCMLHGFPFSMIDALLQGKDTAEAWTMVRQIWAVELTKAYNQIAAKLGDNSALAIAEYNALTQWMMAREASLIALYPENPELVAQTMVKLIMERVNDLCQPGK